MSIVLTLVQQTVIMFLLAGIGYWLFKIRKITPEGSKVLGNLLIYIVLPCVIVKGFLVERTVEKMIALGVASAAGLATIVLSAVVAHLFFKKDVIADFATAFCNIGFFGVPLITGIMGAEAVFYVAPAIAFLNLAQFSYGVSLMTGEKSSLSFKNVIKAPFMVAIIIGALLFFTQLPLPSVITSTISYVSAINTPLAMFVVGVYLAETDILAMFKKPVLYEISAIRLLVIPLLTLALLSLLPSSFRDMKFALLIGMASPVGSNVAVYAQLHNKDYCYAVETVIISVLFSIVTMPAIVWLAQLVWNI